MALVLLTAVPATARAAGPSDCPSASEEAQRLRDKNRYAEARVLLKTCSEQSCPTIVRRDCVRWLAELDERTPSIVVAVQDAAGVDVTDAQVRIDGNALAARLDGRPQPVDPGEHRIEASAAGRGPVTQTFIARAGEKNRAITLRFTPPLAAEPQRPQPPPQPPPTKTANEGGIPTLTWVLGGAGVAALGAFAYLGSTSKSELTQLRSTCAPSCAQGQLDDVKTAMLFADISLAVGVVALGVAAIVAIAHGGSTPRQPRP